MSVTFGRVFEWHPSLGEMGRLEISGAESWAEVNEALIDLLQKMPNYTPRRWWEFWRWGEITLEQLRADAEADRRLAKFNR